MNSASAPLSMTPSGNVALISLNRADKLNAINEPMRIAISEAVQRANDDPDVRVIVFRGAGGRAFSVGADINEFDRPITLSEDRALRRSRRWHCDIAESSKPTIASIHGYCLGGGLELALACDVRIASADAVFGLPEVGLGIIPGAGGTQRLSRIVGLAKALEIVIVGDRIDAEAALAAGLVNWVVPVDDLETRTQDIAARIATNAPIATRYAKEAVRKGSEMSLDDGLRLEMDLASFLVATEDRKEGVRAFREKRKPQYRGL